VILEQERAGEAQALLSAIEQHEFFLSDYSLHSVGLLLFRKRQHEVFRQFLVDVFIEAGVEIIALSARKMEGVIQRMFQPIFDDNCRK
jgi:predicted HTH transcriptional regulator